MLQFHKANHIICYIFLKSIPLNGLHMIKTIRDSHTRKTIPAWCPSLYQHYCTFYIFSSYKVTYASLLPCSLIWLCAICWAHPRSLSLHDDDDLLIQTCIKNETLHKLGRLPGFKQNALINFNWLWNAALWFEFCGFSWCKCIIFNPPPFSFHLQPLHLYV